ncbi:MAG: hypothetical protein IKL55_05520 [Clostridia bacterium]|nr:hypothetical protein [Clostridia bacterium]
MKKLKNKNELKNELYIKIVILIVLILLVIITSFNTGRKFYLLKNTYLESSTGEVNSGVARWNFDAKIIMNNEGETNE